MRIRVCWYKNAGVAGYAEAFRPVQSDSQTSEWYSYFENDVLDCLRQWNFGLYVSGFWHIHAKTPRGIVVCEQQHSDFYNFDYK